MPITVENVTFNGNVAQFGSGMYNANSNSTIQNTTFSSNSATFGGGICNTGSSPMLQNIVFSRNTAQGGGAMYNTSSSNPTLINVTISGNFANDGGGLFNTSSNPRLTNVILWNNIATAITGVQISNAVGSTSVISYSLIEDGVPAGSTDAGNNLTAAPLFVTAVSTTTAGNLRLQDGSPAIDAGLNAAG